MPRSTIRSVKVHTITPSVSGDKPHLDRTRGRLTPTIRSVEVSATTTDHSVSQVPEQVTAASPSDKSGLVTARWAGRLEVVAGNPAAESLAIRWCRVQQGSGGLLTA